MGEILEFKDRRKGFMEQNRVKNVPLAQQRREEPASPIHTRMNTRGLSAEERNRLNARAAREWETLSHREQRKEYQKMRKDLNQNGYKTATINSTRRISGRRTAGNMKGKIFATLGLAAALMIGIGGYTAYSMNSNSQQVTLEEAIKSGKSVEDLGIDADTLTRIQNLETRLNATDIDVIELISIGKELEDLQLDVLKSKLAAEADVRKGDIKTEQQPAPTEDEDTREVILIGEDGVSDWSTLFERGFSVEIEEYIKTIVNTQANNYYIEQGEFDKDAVINRFQNTLEKTSQFAAGDIDVEKDENGKITKINYTKTTVQDLKQQNIEHDDEER